MVGIRKNDKILALSGDGLKAYDNANFDIENNVIKANVNGLEIYRSIIPLAVFSKSALHLSAYKIDDQDIYKIVHKEQLAGGQNGFNINIKITPNQFNTYPEKAIPLENGEPESDLRRNLNNLTIDSNDIELNRLAQQDLTSDQAKENLFHALQAKLYGQDGNRSIQQSALSQQGATWQAGQAILTNFNLIRYGFVEMNSGGINYIVKETEDSKKLISISQKTIPKEITMPGMLENSKPFRIEELPNDGGFQPSSSRKDLQNNLQNNLLAPNGGSRVEMSCDQDGKIRYKISQDSQSQQKLAPILEPIKSSLDLDEILIKVQRYEGDDLSELLNILTEGINENIKADFKEIVQTRLMNYLTAEHLNTPDDLLLDSLFNKNQKTIKKLY